MSVYIDIEQFPDDLFWISKHGIYRTRQNYQPKLNQRSEICIADDEILHPKYNVPARCFAYIGNTSNHKTWKLPYLLANGRVDNKRLSGAVRCIVSNYRGANVKGIPHPAIPNVLKRLAEAAHAAGKMPAQNPKTTATYHQLHDILQILTI